MPAFTSNNVDFAKVLRRILLDLHLLKFLARNGRSMAALAAIESVRRAGDSADAPILNFIQLWVAEGEPDNTPPPADFLPQP